GRHGAEGCGSEPRVSEPRANGQTPRATATAEPLLEPPAMRDESQGFLQSPKCLFSPVKPKAHSCRLVLPRTTAPASTSRRTAVASAAALRPRNAFDPHVVGTPWTSIKSLTP